MCMMTQTPLNATLSITPSYAFLYDARTKTVPTRDSQILPPHGIFWERFEKFDEVVVAHYPLVFVDPLDPSSSAFSSAAFASTLNSKNQHLRCHDEIDIRTRFVPVTISILLESVGGGGRYEQCVAGSCSRRLPSRYRIRRRR